MGGVPKYSIEKAFNRYGSGHILNELSYLIGKALGKFRVSVKEKGNAKRQLVAEFKEYLDKHV